jgi:hypothetical protein
VLALVLLALSPNELAPNDALVADVGPVGDPDARAFGPRIAHNSRDHEQLVVYYANPDPTGPTEVWGRRLDAGTNDPIDEPFQISQTGVFAYDANVAYNATANEYLVVWMANVQPSKGIAPYGQRLSSTGQELGADDFPLSTIAFTSPGGLDVAWAAGPDEYLVVWHGRRKGSGSTKNIRGQRLSGATGAEVGADDFLISDMGPTLTSASGAAWPSVVYNGVRNEYLVVFQGNDGDPSIDPDHIEIFAQRLDAATGAEVGADDFRISKMGQNGTPFGHVAMDVDVAFDPVRDRYFVVWSGSTPAGGGTAFDWDVHGQALSGTGAEIGPDDQRIGGVGTVLTDARAPRVVYGQAGGEFLVVWAMEEFGFFPKEREIYAQRIDAATGLEIGVDDFRISDMGPKSLGYFAASPDVAFDAAEGEYFAAWYGDDNRAGHVRDEFDIYGQRLTGTGLPLAMTLAPTSPLVISSNGGRLAFEGELVNEGSAPLTLELWATITLESGPTTRPVFGPIPVFLAPGGTHPFAETIGVRSTQRIGTHTLTVYAGDWNGLVVTRQDIVFRKL